MANDEPAGQGHNRSPEDVFQEHLSLVLRHKRGPLALAKAAFDAQKKKLKSLLADAKKDNIKLVQFNRTIDALDMDDEDAAASNSQAQRQYDIWAGVDVGEQLDWLEPKNPKPSGKTDAERWYRRGFEDIRFGALDPEGYINPVTGKAEPGMIMPGSPPKYVPAENINDWADGANAANKLNEADFLARCDKKADTPVEQAAKKGRKAKATTPAETTKPIEGAELSDEQQADLAAEFEGA